MAAVGVLAAAIAVGPVAGPIPDANPVSQTRWSTIAAPAFPAAIAVGEVSSPLGPVARTAETPSPPAPARELAAAQTEHRLSLAWARQSERVSGGRPGSQHTPEPCRSRPPPD